MHNFIDAMVKLSMNEPYFHTETECYVPKIYGSLGQGQWWNTYSVSIVTCI